jgi:Mce-associated membrane protein
MASVIGERSNRKERTKMAKSTISEDEMASDAEHTAADRDEADDTVVDGDDACSDPAPKRRFLPTRPWPWVAAALAAAVLAGGVFGYVQYRHVAGQLAELRRNQADREAVAQLAKDYALKSLTYSFEDPDAFFRSVEDGVSQQLKDKYVNATDVLKSIMLQAQVTSTGEVLATDPVAEPGGGYQVVVSAYQTTRNLQNPTPKVSIILLQVTVNRVGDAWQVTDIGPKKGAHPPVEEQLPPPEPLPAPGTPAPKR